jgi:hypothetical protein
MPNPMSMSLTRPEFADPDTSNRLVASDFFLRQAPDDEEEEEEDDRKKKDDDDDDDTSDGYSE